MKATRTAVATALAAAFHAAGRCPSQGNKDQGNTRNALVSRRPARTTASSSCAGTSKMDAQADAWLSVPKGTCEKIGGGKLTSG